MVKKKKGIFQNNGIINIFLGHSSAGRGSHNRITTMFERWDIMVGNVMAFCFTWCSIILTEAHFCFINQQNLVLLLRLWTLAKKHVHPHPREHSPASSSWTYSNTVMVPVICAGLLSFCWIFSFLLCFPISVSYLLFPVLLWSLVLCISMLLLLSPLAHLNCVSFWNQPSKCAYTHTHQPIH